MTSTVSIETMLRLGSGEFQILSDVAQYDGDCDYMPGAIELSIDGEPLLDVGLWDDVNWLWPYLVHAFDDARRNGKGSCSFPDQPITFTVEYFSQSNIAVLSVSSSSIRRRVTASADQVFSAVTHAGSAFFDNYERLCPGQKRYTERDILDSWPSGN